MNCYGHTNHPESVMGGEKSLDMKKLAVTCLALAVLVTVIAVVAFQFGVTYQRQATLNIDVGTMSLHVTVYVQRVGEEPVFWSHHAGVLTTIGKNWIEDQLGDSPSTDPAKWISVSTSTDSPAAGWTQIPTEIATGGLERAAGTYASTGDGVWTISHQFTASATHTNVQLTGLQYAATGDNNLLGADTFTPVTLNSGDKLTVTWTVTVT